MKIIPIILGLLILILGALSFIYLHEDITFNSFKSSKSVSSDYKSSIQLGSEPIKDKAGNLQYRIASVTGNESVLYDVELKGNEVILTPKFSGNMTRQECLTNWTTFEPYCFNVTYTQPTEIKFGKGNSIAEADIDADSRDKVNKDFFKETFTIELDGAANYYKIGEESIIIVGDTSYPINQSRNITQEVGFVHLNISRQSPYDGLILYYPFDGDISNITANDFSTRNNNGVFVDDTVNNGISSTNCLFGNCFVKTTVSNELINIDDPFNLPGGSDDRSIVYWARATSAFDGFVFNYGDSSGGQLYGGLNDPLGACGSGSATNSSAIIGSGGGGSNVCGTTDLDDSRWHHYAFTYGGGVLKIFVDGNNEANGSLVNPTDLSGAAVGGAMDGTQTWGGNFDDFMIFNKTLTINEINAMRNNQSARYLPSGEMIFYNKDLSGFTKVNFTLNNAFTYLNSNLSVFVNDATPIFFSGKSANNYNILGLSNLNNANITIRLNAGNSTFNSTYNPFASPIAYGNITIDLFDPLNLTLNITYPLSRSYPATVTSLNYTITGDTPQACWYSINLGLTNTSITCGNNITGLSAPEGSSTWYIYANSSIGNNGSYSVTFSVDTIPPNILFVPNTAASGSTITFLGNIPINVTANDTQAISNITLRLYNGSHTLLSTVVSTSSPFNYTFLNQPDGLYFFNATARDAANNLNNTETRNVTLLQDNIYNVTGCMVINTQGIYNQLNDIIANLDPCITFNASNVVYNGLGRTLSIGGNATSDHAVLIRNGNNLTLRNSIINETYLNQTSADTEAIEVRNATNVSIINNSITISDDNAPIYGITSISGGVQDLIISQNIINTNCSETFQAGVTCGLGIFANDVKRGKIDNNYINTYGTGDINYGIRLENVNTTNINISRNNISVDSYLFAIGISMTNSNSTLIEYNNISTNASLGGFNNNFQSVGIFGSTTNNSFIHNNIINVSSNNTFTSQGISFSSAGLLAGSNNLVQNNKIQSENGNAIFIDMAVNSANNTFKNNTIIRVSRYSLVIARNGTNGTILINQYISNYSINYSQLKVEDTTYGQITFLNYINGIGSNLSADIKIGNNTAEVNSSKVGLNVSANISLYGIGDRGFNFPALLRNNLVHCTNNSNPSCANFTSLEAATVNFNVSAWTNYSIGETPDSTLPIVIIYQPVQNNLYLAPTIPLNVTVTDPQPSIGPIAQWWSLNFGLTNTTWSPIGTNTSMIIQVTGDYNVTVYANDSAGNIGSSSSFFSVINATGNATVNVINVTTSCLTSNKKFGIGKSTACKNFGYNNDKLPKLRIIV